MSNSDSNAERTTKQELWAALGMNYTPPTHVTHVGDGVTPLSDLPAFTADTAPQED
ncbi:hypothetical protein [Curtobacterium sp. MCSS17_011]|uniref:hypothetical protein n=1 Tax=Curtobacterium sp. MCSS17_011 TaxID=2175643 RepID=UPI0015E8A7B6|nr:hypothetical protein [Curtobacterium sp. MCSS17_011]